VWGIKQGLPFAYNAEENAHFLLYAIGMFNYCLAYAPRVTSFRCGNRSG
jgi:hypothetical protein